MNSSCQARQTPLPSRSPQQHRLRSARPFPGGGGALCGFTRAAFIPLAGDPVSPPAGTAPAGIRFAHGLIDFVTSGCVPGSTLTFVVTMPNALPTTTQYWKYGPTPGNATPHWYTIPATTSGNTVTFTITDGGLGDDDLVANGTIVDQGGPGNLLLQQAITLSAPASFIVGTGSIVLSGAATSGLPVIYSTISGPCQLSGQTVTSSSAGACVIRASQSGNDVTAAANMDINVSALYESKTSLATLSGTVIRGQPVDLVAAVTGSSPTGTVTFYRLTPGATIPPGGSLSVANSLPSCANIPLSGGKASCRVADAMDAQYVANYSGDGLHATSSAVLGNLEVRNLLSTFTLSTDIGVAQAGKTIRLTALVRGNAPRGKVSFTSNGTPIANCTGVGVIASPPDFNSVLATCTTTAVSGSHTYTATYSADAANNFPPASISINAGSVGPDDYSDLWWGGDKENGWGMTITQKGLQQFNALYVYDNTGKPVWYVMPGGRWNTNFTQFTGTLYQPTGTAFDQYDVSKWQAGTPVGSATLTFNALNSASLAYTIGGVAVTRQISRLKFGAPESTPRLPVKDIWWGGDRENGWGLSLSQQGDNVFAAWYTYDAAGKTTWYVMPSGGWSGTSYVGQLYSTSGSSWLGGNYDATKLSVKLVGVMWLDFIDANSATMTYTVNGVTQTKFIQRLPF
jgi:hypothetical protein